MSTIKSPSIFLSAYRKFHSAETAQARILNDLLMAMNHRKVFALVLLDSSAAFDTIDHGILLKWLRSSFGISDSALPLLYPYLADRTQTVTIDQECSNESPLQCLVGSIGRRSDLESEGPEFNSSQGRLGAV